MPSQGHTAGCCSVCLLLSFVVYSFLVNLSRSHMLSLFNDNIMQLIARIVQHIFYSFSTVLTRFGTVLKA